MLVSEIACEISGCIYYRITFCRKRWLMDMKQIIVANVNNKGIFNIPNSQTSFFPQLSKYQYTVINSVYLTL